MKKWQFIKTLPSSYGEIWKNLETGELWKFDNYYIFNSGSYPSTPSIRRKEVDPENDVGQLYVE